MALLHSGRKGGAVPKGARAARAGDDGDGLRSASPSGKLLRHFDMYGLPLQEALQMEEVRLHEDLMRDQLLVVVTDQHKVVFISHMWLGVQHPDPHGQQLRALRRILDSLARGCHDLHPHWMESLGFGDRTISAKTCKQLFGDAHLWMDYWCVPQATQEPGVPELQAAAIRSIPAYVARANHFLALVPPCSHANRSEVCGHRQWRNRAWCRLELLSHIFSHSGGSMLVAETEHTVRLAMSHTWLFLPPGNGELTCCNVGHRLLARGQERAIPCDKEAIGPVVEDLYDMKLKSFERAGDWETFRFYRALRGQMLKGLPIGADAATSAAQSVEAFLREYHFQSAFDEEGPWGSGWSPLRFAAIEGNTGVMKALLERKANVESPLKSARMDLMHFKRTSILASAITIHSKPEVLQILLEHGASLNLLSSPHGYQPAHACRTAEGLEVLIAHGQSPSRQTDVFGSDALMMGLYQLVDGSSTEDYLHHIIDRDLVPPRHGAFGVSHLHCAVLGGSISITKKLLERPAFVRAAREAQEGDKSSATGRLIFRGLRLKALFRGHDPNLENVMEVFRCSPLHLASCEGDLEMIRLLLDHGFTIDSRNSRGRTPIHMACISGQTQVLRLFADEVAGFGEAAQIRCAYAGRTARELAEERGFEDLARLLPESEPEGPGRMAGFCRCCSKTW